MVRATSAVSPSARVGAVGHSRTTRACWQVSSSCTSSASPGNAIGSQITVHTVTISDVSMKRLDPPRFSCRGRQRSVCRQLRPFPCIRRRANVNVVFVPDHLTANTLARAGRWRRQWRAQNAVDECVAPEDIRGLCFESRSHNDTPGGRANVSVCPGVPEVDRLLKVFASDSQTSVARHRPDIYSTEAVQWTQVEPAMRNVHVCMKAVVRVIGVSSQAVGPMRDRIAGDPGSPRILKSIAPSGDGSRRMMKRVTPPIGKSIC